MKADRQAPIGVFDSGVGGLTVVREIMRNLPDERIVYFGDTARVPYGSKSKNTVIRYSRQIVHFLETQQVKAIVIACNTASALALDTIEKEIDLPIIGVVKPGAQMAVETTQNKRVGVIATESTIQSGLYQQLITEADPAITVYGKPCPLFVPLVENGRVHRGDVVIETVVKEYLTPLKDAGVDTLILGCTHYPFLSDAEAQRFGTGKEEIGKCPRCGSPVYVGKGNFYCSNKECSFCLWEDNKFFSSKKKKLTKRIAKELLDKGWCRVTGLYTPKKPQLYDAVIRLDDSGGKYVSFKMEFDK